MPALPTGLSDLERWAVFASAVAAGILALGVMLRKAWRGFTSARDWVREGVRSARALERLVTRELQPNHGSSLHDTVTELGRQLAQTREGVDLNRARLDKVEASLSTLAESQLAIWPAIEAVARAEPPKREDAAP